MIQADPRLPKLAKIIALHDDPAATEGERAACRHVGVKLAAELGIEFSADAIERASAGRSASNKAFQFDVDAWVREWMAMTPAQHRAWMAEADRIINELKRSNEERKKEEAERKAKREKEEAEREAELAKFREAERLRREAETARRNAEREAELAERERVKRVRAGLEPPQWDDIDDDHLEWLSRIEKLELDEDEGALVSLVRRGVRNGCLGMYGNSMLRMNALLARAHTKWNEENE